MGDLGALIAPRALLIESGSKDPLNGSKGIANVLSQLKITQKAYRLLDVKDHLAHDIFDDGHRWNGEKTTPWLYRWLG